MTLNHFLLRAWLSALASFAFAVSAAAQTPAAGPDKLAKRGERLFLLCVSCHEVTDTKSAKIGPTLKGVGDRKVAGLEGYNYSAAIKALNFAWDDTQLDRWLAQPMQMAPGTTMAFAGVPAAEDRKALIAYLRTLK